uniref:3-ketoacyl-[acyl-carrier-protein] reductase beta subunit n=1 Tax=Graphocephala atropunctata TaxID=36148 RepID=A0A1B6LRD3_9HEMI
MKPTPTRLSNYCQDLMKTIVQKYNRPPNILVNCAAIVGFVTTLDETPETFQRVLQVNLMGIFFTCQAVCKELIAANLPGSIVNVSAISVLRGMEGLSAYTASKAGVDAITKCMARDMSEHNIRVNSVQPGGIATQMASGLGSRQKPSSSVPWISLLATKRTGQPQEVAEVITFLTSDRASYINGALVPVSGGY